MPSTWLLPAAVRPLALRGFAAMCCPGEQSRLLHVGSPRSGITHKAVDELFVQFPAAAQFANNQQR
jgi:hypothetical protein